jgi:hypothetical protein
VIRPSQREVAKSKVFSSGSVFDFAAANFYVFQDLLMSRRVKGF